MGALPDRSNERLLGQPRRALLFDIPPFPGRHYRKIVRLEIEADVRPTRAECIAAVREKRVGGTYWAAQPAVPPAYLLVRSQAALKSSSKLVEHHGEMLGWFESNPSSEIAAIVGQCDPWHMLKGAQALVCDADDEVRIIAALLGVATYIVDPNGDLSLLCEADVAALLEDAMPIEASFADPFGGKAINLIELIELCGFWRSLIDANRSISGGGGFAFWKQASVLPLLWGGGNIAGFFSPLASERSSGGVAIWRSRTSPGIIDQLERRGIATYEVEDGFLRSNGLGADCIPPLSIVIDRLGPYFDPGQPSELENILEHSEFAPSLLARARSLRKTIVAAGLGKYDQGDAILERFDAGRRHILVAGQVEDDRSILTGGSGLASNLELLQMVRAREPNAYLVYKPHPDVVAGHRKGYISENIGRQFADKVITGGSISSLIAAVDEVHVNTSLAGFEALMRFKDVTTYGVPFYAGWGLTRDLGPVPARRTTKRSLDELVAATLLLYPRYLDPVSGLPCPAEIVVDRLAAPTSKPAGALVRLRRLQGRLMRRVTTWRSA